jgi:hypothetical protein
MASSKEYLDYILEHLVGLFETMYAELPPPKSKKNG